MPQKKCNKDCLNCILPKCRHDIEDEYKDLEKRYEKVRHAEYYKAHREEIKDKVRKYNAENRNTKKCHEYYLRNRERMLEKNHRLYAQNREELIAKSKEYYWTHREEILARRKEKYHQRKGGAIA